MSLGSLADVKVEIGFGVDAVGGSFFVLNDPVKGELNNATYVLAPDTVMVNVSSHVAAVSTNRGRERELDGYKTGTATVVFNDSDRTFDPSYAGTPGYVDLPGTASNYLSTPDAAALDITGDITIVARVAMDDWTPGTFHTICNKRLSTITQSYRLYVQNGPPAGVLTLITSPDGTDAAQVLYTSTAAVSAADGAWKWVAATLDVDNGAAGKSARFWTSDDGATWTQLGTTVTTGGTTSIFASTSLLEIGVTAGTVFPLAGNIQHVSIRNGIGAAGIVGGTEVFRFDGDRDIGDDTAATTLTATTGQTITVNRSGSPSTTLVQVTGQYAGEIVPMKRIAISWQNEDMFNGWVDDWSVTYEPGDSLSRVTATCVDGFAILANQQLAEIAAAHSGDRGGERIDRVLDLPEVDFSASRSIDAGLSTLGATTFGDNALSYIQACARAEAGYLFIAADGVLTFRDRSTTLNQTADAVLSDDRTAGIPYRTVTQRSSADLLYTRVTGQSETTGVEMMAFNAAAAADYLIKNLDLGTLLLRDDAEVQNLVDYYLERFSQVEHRFDTAAFNVVALTATQVQTIVSLDLTDVVTVERAPLNVGAAISKLSMVDGISHRIGHGSWNMELSFTNVDIRTFFVLDDAVLGVLDTDLLAF